MLVITRRNWLAALGAGAASMPVRMAAQQPARQPLDLSEYQPKSMLRVHETKVDRARYPVIDIHTHLSFAAKGEKGEKPKLSADATGTSFEGGASALVEFVPGLLLSSIPRPFLGVYLSEGFGGVGTVSEVTVIRPTTAASTAKGQIIVLGFDWTFGAPVGTVDGGWTDVLHRALEFASRSF